MIYSYSYIHTIYETSLHQYRARDITCSVNKKNYLFVYLQNN